MLLILLDFSSHHCVLGQKASITGAMENEQLSSHPGCWISKEALKNCRKTYFGL
jgi:hypothetical protein